MRHPLLAILLVGCIAAPTMAQCMELPDDPASLDEATFLAGDPESVVATARDGTDLRQMDVDIMASCVAWAFDVRLTERQRALVHKGFVEHWEDEAGPDETGALDMWRSMPGYIQQMDEPTRAKTQSDFRQMLLADADDSDVGKMIKQLDEYSQPAVEIDDGPVFTYQDAFALLEYLCFQAWMQTGTYPQMSMEEAEAFVMQAAQMFEQASPEEQEMLARMDEDWGKMRAAWEQASLQQRQQIQGYYPQQADFGYYDPGAYLGSYAGGGEMSDSQFSTVMDALNTDHYASMNTLNGIDGETYGSMYDGNGDWLYDY